MKIILKNFTRTILHYNLTREEAVSKEQDILCNIDAANNFNFYNLHNYSGRGWSHHDNPELANIYYDRISKAKKGNLVLTKESSYGAIITDIN